MGWWTEEARWEFKTARKHGNVQSRNLSLLLPNLLSMSDKNPKLQSFREPMYKFLLYLYFAFSKNEEGGSF
jgi:hypothetical protein